MTMTLHSGQPDYANERVVERDRLQPRAYFPFAHPKYEVLLNGRWRFHCAQSPLEAPHPSIFSNGGGKRQQPMTLEEDGSEGTRKESDIEWTHIEVPGHWQLQGFGHPHYTNVQYPFPCHPPDVPSQNPTGTYWRTFALPSSWKESDATDPLRYRVRFEGVDSAFHVFLNGSEVGYSQGSRNAAEFDISKFLVNGENHLVVQVYQWCDGSYIEDQDQWWLSGIFRDVKLLATREKGFIEDFHVETELDGAYMHAKLKVWTKSVGPKEKSNCGPTSWRFTLRSPTGEVIHNEMTRKQQGPIDESMHVISVQNPLKWTAETPYLYTLTLQLIQNGERAVHRVEQAVGFRSVEIADGVLKVNGRAILLKGVNRHDHWPTLGRAVALEHIRHDLTQMKRHNINALRCSHYPNRPELLQLADELGLYVMDETDLECHGFYDAVARPLDVPEDMDYEERKRLCFGQAAAFTSDNPSWELAYVDRIKQMVHRDRNHPSVIMWSLGNEAFYGRNHKAMYDWAKKNDPARPVHYEGDIEALSADLYSYMYPAIDDLVKLAEGGTRKSDKPILLCEYGHAMGNGPGALREYQDAFEKHPRLQGGYIWEWANHGLLHQSKGADGSKGPPFLAYGGDFGDEPNDSTFVMDGLCNSWHEPMPGLLEFKKVIEPVRLAVSKEGNDFKEIKITNNYTFLSLDHLRASWIVIDVGKRSKEVLASGELSLPSIAPGHSFTVVWSPRLPHVSSTHRFVRFIFQQREATNWCDSGHEVAWGEFSLWNKLTGLSTSSGSDIRTEESPSQIIATGPESHLVFDKINGRLREWSCNGRSMFLEGGSPRLTFWRAPTDNDQPHDAPYWKRFGLDAMDEVVRGVTTQRSSQPHGSGFEATVTSWLAPPVLAWGFRTTTIYRVSGGGDLEIRVHCIPEGPSPKTLPRIGLEMRLPDSLSRVRWFGHGPHESYRDKKESARLNVWSLGVDEFATPYEVPQENGNRHRTRWAELSADSGVGLRVWAEKRTPKAPSDETALLFDFNVQRHTARELQEAAHPHELPPSKGLVLRVDAAHHGLGTGSCGPGVLPQHELTMQEFEFSVFLQAVKEAPGWQVGELD